MKKIVIPILKKINYKLYTKLRFKKIHGYNLNLDNPKTFSEKIQWTKLFSNLEIYGKYVDKYEVRNFVDEKVGTKYLIPLLGCHTNANEINFEKLPNKFVIKATHASGWNLIVKDKSKLDINAAKKEINNWVNNSFFELTGERNYKNIPGRVVIEEFIEDDSNDLMDYRFFCYDGVPEFIQVDSYTSSQKRRNIYNVQWEKIDLKCSYQNIMKEIKKPEKFEEMKEIAKRLSEGIPFVRIDLYFVNDMIYFGEMTFTPQNGYGTFDPVKYDLVFGEKWRLTDGLFEN